MPDENKLEALRAAGYRVRGGCGSCAWGRFPRAEALWGTCRQLRYDHLKHDNPAEGREASVHAYGSCAGFEADPRARARLGAHAGFAEF